MDVVYSIGARLGGSGIGYTGYQGVLASHRAGRLRRLLVGSLAPGLDLRGIEVRGWGGWGRLARYVSSRLGPTYSEAVVDFLFDRWAARRLTEAGVLHVWHGHGLQTLRAARERGMATVVERASTHPAFVRTLLAGEHRRWGRAWREWGWHGRRLAGELELADRVLVPSRFAYETFLEAGFPKAKLHLLPYGVDTERFRPGDRGKAEPFRALFVGQVGLRKGVPYLLEAWRLLGWRDAELVLAGRVLPEMRALLARHRSLPGLRILGHRGPVEEVYAAADVFVFPSLEEGCALVVLEAMASGLPVVTTPNAGVPLEDGAQGLLAPIRDPAALAAALEALRSDPARRQAMAVAARVRALGQTWDGYRQGLLDLYDRLA